MVISFFKNRTVLVIRFFAVLFFISGLFMYSVDRYLDKHSQKTLGTITSFVTLQCESGNGFSDHLMPVVAFSLNSKNYTVELGCPDGFYSKSLNKVGGSISLKVLHNFHPNGVYSLILPKIINLTLPLRSSFLQHLTGPFDRKTTPLDGLYLMVVSFVIFSFCPLVVRVMKKK